MNKYIVRKTYQYTEDVEVAANSEKEALRFADTTTGERNYDDHLYDCEVVSCEDGCGL